MNKNYAYLAEDERAGKLEATVSCIHEEAEEICRIATKNTGIRHYWLPRSTGATILSDRPASSFYDYGVKITHWLAALFGKENVGMKTDRAAAFVEEATELVQSLGMTREQMLEVVDYVYSREPGKPKQEFAGTGTTLHALAHAYGFNIHREMDEEIDRIWGRLPTILERTKEKPNFIVSAIRKD